MNVATRKQQKYLDHAFRYAQQGMECYKHELWSEAATDLGSALESLLRIRFGSGGNLFALIDKFDKDPLFDGILMHEGGSRKCTTCSADEIRKLRNAVHPDRWKQAVKKDVDQAVLLVLMLYHVLVACEGSRVAVFQKRPDTTLSILEAAGFQPEPVKPHGDNHA